MKNNNIMRVHKKTIHMGNCLKRAEELGKFAEGLVKNREGVFEGGGDTSMRTDLILVHDRTQDWTC